MFLLHEYDIFWTFLIIASLIPILAFSISGLLAPVSEGPEKLSSYESGIEPMGGAWVQFRIRYYMFALVFVVFDVETVFLYPWATFRKFETFGMILNNVLMEDLAQLIWNGVIFNSCWIRTQWRNIIIYPIP
jgi:NAD(P)H-quinone oxidoreductase subunit 3